MLYAFSVYLNILIMRRYTANNLLKKNSARSSWDICPEVVCKKFLCFRRLWRIACTAMWELLFFLSLRSKRFRASSSRTLGREQKKKRNDGNGGGERRKRLPANPTPPQSLSPPSPHPPSHSIFFCSRSNFRAISRLETLATQANFFLIFIGNGYKWLINIWRNLAEILFISHFKQKKFQNKSWTKEFCDTRGVASL